MRLISIPVIVALLIGFALTARAEETWQLAKRDEDPDAGFALYAMRTEGNLRYRLETSFPADPEQALQAVLRAMIDPRFVPERQQRRILEHDDAGAVLHTQIDMPMMVSDRDVALRVTSETDEDTGIRRVRWRGVSDHAALPEPADGTVRITHVGGYWEFVPDGAGHCHATYVSFTDPGGSLPKWLVEPMMRNQMIQDTQRVRELLSERSTAVSASPPH